MSNPHTLEPLDKGTCTIQPDEVDRLLDKWTVGHVLFVQNRFVKFARAESLEMDSYGFRNLFSELSETIPNLDTMRIFRQFDSQGLGLLTFRDVCLGLATSCISSWDTRVRFVFGGFDSRGDGHLSIEEVTAFLQCVVLAVRRSNLSGDFSVHLIPDPLALCASGAPRQLMTLDRIESCVTAIQSDAQSLVGDRHSRSSEYESGGVYLLSDLETGWISDQIEVLTKSRTSQLIDFQDTFLPWSCSNSIYVHKFIELLELVPSPEKERRICLNILRKSIMAPGTTWYVVSYKWIQLWKSYVHWTDSDSVGTIWSHATCVPAEGGAIHQGTVVSSDPGGFGILHTMSAFDMISCTSTVFQQRMSERPNSVNNSDLEGEFKGELRRKLVEHHDYLLVPEEMWKNLMEWYGGGPVFPRKVVAFRVRKLSSIVNNSLRYVSSTAVDLYPPLITVVLCGDDGYPIRHFTKRFFVSKADDCADLISQLSRKLINSDATDTCRLWHRQHGQDWELILADDPRRIEDFVDSVSTDAGTFMLERMVTEGWPRDRLHTTPSTSAGDPVGVMNSLDIGDRVDAKGYSGWKRATIVDVSEGSVKVHFDGEPYRFDAWLSCDSDEIAPLGTHIEAADESESVVVQPTKCGLFGLKHPKRRQGALIQPKLLRRRTGLENIGNTCFMNAVLQCLSRTPMLREYFLTKDFRHHLRTSAKVASEFASLLDAMWNTSTEYYAPRAFKRAIERYAPRFAGYDHQDAHELLAVLLDGLHEDLNRGLPPQPPRELDSTTGTSKPAPVDPIVLGDSEWKNHRISHTSIIADLFDGLQRITTTCQSCNYQTSNFEPHRYVLLPVPDNDRRSIVVHLVPLATPSNPKPKMQKLHGNVHRNSHVQDLLLSLSLQYPAVTKQFGVEWDEGIVVAEVYLSRIHRFIDVCTNISEFRSDDLVYIFQVASDTAGASAMPTRCSVGSLADPNTIVHEYTGTSAQQDIVSMANNFGAPCFAQIFNRREVLSKRRRNKTTMRMELFGMPMIVAVNLRSTHSHVWKVVHSQVDRFFLEGCPKPPFVLRIVGPDGMTCTTCSSTSCSGCEILEHSNQVISIKGGWLYLALDWLPGAYSLNSDTVEQPLCTLVVDDSVVKTAELDPISRAGTNQPKVSLYDCMDAYTSAEALTGDNRWLCDQCKQKSDAERKICWWISPDILVVLLKRFQYTNAGFEKVTAAIDFPLKGLQVKPGKPGISPQSYDLYGVVNHYGNLSSGHYTALCQEEGSDAWFMYNDRQVSPVSAVDLPSEIVNSTKTCYVLFYKRNGTRPANVINYGTVPTVRDSVV